MEPEYTGNVVESLVGGVKTALMILLSPGPRVKDVSLKTTVAKSDVSGTGPMDGKIVS